jgi:predicted 3-demethylubiquinone-9 3-methyltransferase (glyoxalase superfamily)
VPSALETLMSDPERSQRVVAAFMKMGKLDIETLRRA